MRQNKTNRKSMKTKERGFGGRLDNQPRQIKHACVYRSSIGCRSNEIESGGC